MPRTNWLRLIIGILIATLIMFFSDGFFHERIVVADWTAVYTALGIRPPVHSTANLLYFFIFELGRGILAMSLYVMLRVCWKPGPAAAALAGIVMWLAFSSYRAGTVHSARVLFACALAQGRWVSPGYVNHRDNRGRGDLQKE